MSNSFKEKFSEQVESLHQKASRYFAVTIQLDSTGGRFMFQPLSARPWLKALVVLACFPVFGTIALIIHFNLGALWSVPFVIAVLWVFAEIRSQDPAPVQIEARFYKAGRIRIKSGSNELNLPFVGPVWEQQGLIFALVHEHRTFRKNLDDGATGLLGHLQTRARKLGHKSWTAAQFEDKGMTFWPNARNDGSETESMIRNSMKYVFEHAVKKPPRTVILLGRPVDRDSKGFVEQYDLLVSLFNILTLRNLSRWLSVK